MDKTSMASLQAAEPVFVNVYGAQETIPPGWESTVFLGSLKGLRALVSYLHMQYMHQLR
jgi:hypothetical protein